MPSTWPYMGEVFSPENSPNAVAGTRPPSRDGWEPKRSSPVGSNKAMVGVKRREGDGTEERGGGNPPPVNIRLFQYYMGTLKL